MQRSRRLLMLLLVSPMFAAAAVAAQAGSSRQPRSLRAVAHQQRRELHSELRQVRRRLHSATSADGVVPVGEGHVMAIGRKRINTEHFRVCELNTKAGPKSFVVPKNDEYVGKSICMHGAWDQSALDLMQKYIPEGGTVVDAGANIGAYTVSFSHHVGPHGRIYSFEPQWMIYHVMTTNAIFSGNGNIITHNAALSFKNGYFNMARAIPDGINAGMEFEKALDSKQTINFGGRMLGRGGERVRMYMLDDLKLQNVSFIKVDVQGAEKLVFWGAQETIKRCRPVVNLENSPDFTAKVMNPPNIAALGIPPEVVQFEPVKFLESLGYKLVDMTGEDLIYVPSTDAAPGRH